MAAPHLMSFTKRSSMPRTAAAISACFFSSACAAAAFEAASAMAVL